MLPPFPVVPVCIRQLGVGARVARQMMPVCGSAPGPRARVVETPLRGASEETVEVVVEVAEGGRVGGARGSAPGDDGGVGGAAGGVVGGGGGHVCVAVPGGGEWVRHGEEGVVGVCVLVGGLRGG